jgi:hypothetical protein
MIVTIGASVCWEQGLLEEHKFDRILAERARQPLPECFEKAPHPVSRSPNAT